MTSKYPAAVTKKLINYRDNERRTALQFLLMKNTSKNESTSEFREKKTDILKLILENGAEPSFGDLQFLFCGDIGLDGLKLFLDNEALGLKELLLDGLRKSKCYYRKSDLPAPFLKGMVTSTFSLCHVCLSFIRSANKRFVRLCLVPQGFFLGAYQGQSTPVGTRKIEFLHSQIEFLHFQIEFLHSQIEFLHFFH